MIDKMPNNIRMYTQAGGDGDLYALSLVGVYPVNNVRHFGRVIVAKDRVSAEQQAEQLVLEAFPDAESRSVAVGLVLINWNPHQ